MLLASVYTLYTCNRWTQPVVGGTIVKQYNSFSKTEQCRILMENNETMHGEKYTK